MRTNLKTRVFELYVDDGPYNMVALAEKLGYTVWHLSRIRHGHVPVAEQFIARCCLRPGHDKISELFYLEEL